MARIGSLLLLLLPVAATSSPVSDSCADFDIANSSTGLVDSKTLLAAVNASDPTDCCSKCTAEPKCVAFTFTYATVAPCRMTSSPYPHIDHHKVFSGQSKTRPPVVLPTPAPGPKPPKPGPNPFPPKYPDYCKTNKCHNVLYILSDDMRADWGTYGLPVMTPNLDALSKEALLFEHAFCQISVCSPSRQSFMTSRRPDTHQVWNFIDANPLTTQLSAFTSLLS